MSIVVDVGEVSNSGAQLKSAAQEVPDPVRVPEDSGDVLVDEAVSDYLTSVGRCCIGAATAVYGLGQDAAGAAAAFAEVDRGLVVESA